MHYYRHPAKLSSLVLAGSLTLLTTQAMASAFFLHEQNAALLGGFYAGSAAVAEDASTNWYNPAGLTRLEGGNFVASATNISSQTEFTGTTGNTTITPFGDVPYHETGEASGSAARLVPAMHGAWKFNKQWAVGLSVVTPYGLSTVYEEDSIARYNATESEIKTIDISPSIAYQPIDWFSIGVGFDAEYAEAKLNSIAGTPGPCELGGAPATCADSASLNKGSSWGYGWHAGVLAVLEESQTQIGLAFHSNIEQDLEGRSSLHGELLNPEGFKSNDLSSDIDLPWWFVLSVDQGLGDYFSVLGSVEYIHWSSIEQLVLNGVQSAEGAVITASEDLDYENTWGFFGAVRLNVFDNLMVSLGGAYEQTPTTDEERDLRLPDANRWIASGGIRWTPDAAPKAQFDVGYAHIWGQEVDINKTITTGDSIVTATGTDSSQVNLVGVSVTVKI